MEAQCIRVDVSRSVVEPDPANLDHRDRIAPVVLGRIETADAVNTRMNMDVSLITVRRIRWFDRPSDLLMLFVWVLVSGLGYRQLNLFWRMAALGSARREWGEMERLGFGQAGAAA